MDNLPAAAVSTENVLAESVSAFSSPAPFDLTLLASESCQGSAAANVLVVLDLVIVSTMT